MPLLEILSIANCLMYKIMTRSKWCLCCPVSLFFYASQIIPTSCIPQSCSSCALTSLTGYYSYLLNKIVSLACIYPFSICFAFHIFALHLWSCSSLKLFPESELLLVLIPTLVKLHFKTQHCHNFVCLPADGKNRIHYINGYIQY